MFDISSHKYYLVRILKDIYSDPLLSSVLGFKGGTAHMLFYNLPRFSVDLDFNLLDKTESDLVFQKLRNILSALAKLKMKLKNIMVYCLYLTMVHIIVI